MLTGKQTVKILLLTVFKYTFLRNNTPLLTWTFNCIKLKGHQGLPEGGKPKLLQ